jgi:uncharacterized Zn-binding protein involved in type VI secretion
MGQAAAKKGDRVTATDQHVVTPGNAMISFPFNGVIDGEVSPNVNFDGRPAATVGSTATNTPPHTGAFAKPPSNRGLVLRGSGTVNINGRPAARNGDPALTCNDPVDLPVGQVVASGSVNIG